MSDLFTKLPGLKPALFTALWTFIALFATSVIGALQAVQEWTGGSAEFPDLSVLAAAAVSAAMAALGGFVGFVIRTLQAYTGLGTVPTYDGPVDRGGNPLPPQ
jgi:hypothetical protein